MTAEVTEFLVSENLFYQQYGLSFVYQAYAMSLCGQSHLQVVDCSAVIQTNAQCKFLFKNSGLFYADTMAPTQAIYAAQPTYVTGTVSPYIVPTAQTVYTPLPQQHTGHTGYY